MSHYPASIAVTWQTSVDQLTTPARRLLERLAWLGPEPIPESLLDVPIPVRPEPEAEQNPHDALVDLATYSLVTRANETPTFTVHRLVQDVTRRSLREVSGNEPLDEALWWVTAAFDGDSQDVRTWPTLDPLSPHARAVVVFADSVGISDPTAWLMDQLGRLYLNKSSFAEAEPLMRRALAIDEANLGEDHPDVGRVLNNLAALLLSTNRFAEAELLMIRVVTIVEKSLGENHPYVAPALNNLAQLLQDTNRLAEAEPLMRRALSIDEASFGVDHRNAARALNNLAALLQDMSRFAEAEPLMRRALAIDEESCGADHPYVAIELNNLAQLLKATNRVAEAEPLMRRVLVIFLDLMRRTGHEHPNLKAAFGNYRVLLQEIGKSDDQIEAAFATLEIQPPS